MYLNLKINCVLFTTTLCKLSCTHTYTFCLAPRDLRVDCLLQVLRFVEWYKNVQVLQFGHKKWVQLSLVSSGGVAVLVWSVEPLSYDPRTSAISCSNKSIIPRPCMST